MNPVEAKLCLNSIKKTKNGLVVKYDKKSESQLKSCITEKFGSEYSVKPQKSLKPRLLVKHVYLCDNQTDADLFELVRSFNNIHSFDRTHVKIIAKIKSKFDKSESVNFIVEVSPSLRDM